MNETTNEEEVTRVIEEYISLYNDEKDAKRKLNTLETATVNVMPLNEALQFAANRECEREAYLETIKMAESKREELAFRLPEMLPYGVPVKIGSYIVILSFLQRHKHPPLYSVHIYRSLRKDAIASDYWSARTGPGIS